MAVDKVIDMVAMRHCLVAAIRTVGVGLLMGGTVVGRRTVFRIGCADLNLVVVHVSTVGVVQVAIMKIIDVAIVPYRRMAAVWAVLVRVSTRVYLVSFRHDFPFCQPASAATFPQAGKPC